MRWMAAVFFTLMAAGADYRLAPAPNAKFQLEVQKTGLMSGKVHVFTFERYAGELSYSASAAEQSSVSFTLENNSIVCRDTWVNEKDKVKIVQVAHESMDTAKHPQLSFRSRTVVRRADGDFDVSGPLSIKGIARPITIRVSVTPEGNALRVRGRATILRKDYGVNPKAAVPFGLIGNKEEMPVQFELLATPR
ncbi:MAG: YceI family protein [Acidobacteria bacterium]|nr:YceI family protein [Acidobacteriota bacterium]